MIGQILSPSHMSGKMISKNDYNHLWKRHKILYDRYKVLYNALLKLANEPEYWPKSEDGTLALIEVQKIAQDALDESART